MRLLEDSVLRKTLMPDREEVTRGWKKLRKEELHDLRSSQNSDRLIESKLMKSKGRVTRMGENTNTYRALEGKPERNRTFGRPRHKWEKVLNCILNTGMAGRGLE